MTISLFGVIVGEGNPEELALYTTLFFNGMKEAQRIHDEDGITKIMNDLFKPVDEKLKKKSEE